MANRVKTNAPARLEKSLFYFLSVLAIVGLLAYLGLVQWSIFNVSARNTAEEEISNLAATVAGLETDYLALSSAEVTPARATALGFLDVSEHLDYVTKTRTTLTLLLSANEI